VHLRISNRSLDPALVDPIGSTARNRFRRLIRLSVRQWSNSLARQCGSIQKVIPLFRCNGRIGHW